MTQFARSRFACEPRIIPVDKTGLFLGLGTLFNGNPIHCVLPAVLPGTARETAQRARSSAQLMCIVWFAEEPQRLAREITPCYGALAVQ
jgi:hypothetical protein